MCLLIHWGDFYSLGLILFTEGYVSAFNKCQQLSVFVRSKHFEIIENARNHNLFRSPVVTIQRFFLPDLGSVDAKKVPSE